MSDEMMEKIRATPVEWDNVARRELKELLGNRIFLMALRMVLDEADERLQGFRTIPLETDAGLASARKIQGVVEGLNRAVDIILENADGGEDEPGSGPDHSE